MFLASVNMGNIIVKAAVSDFAIQWALFVVAATFQTEKFYDLAGSATFLLLGFKSLQWGETYFARQKIQTGMVLTWALRLGMYLFVRVMKDGGDRRFNSIKKSLPMFFGAWTMQALWILITLLPTLILNSKKQDKPLTSKDYVGWSMWLVGFLIEVIADYQKSAFRNNPDNTGKFISSGLWSVSRHPNYFGEILLWSGLYVSASSVFRGGEYLSVLSPAFVALLITKLSGIPILERSGLKRWGGDLNYQQYLKNTALLVPFLW